MTFTSAVLGFAAVAVLLTITPGIDTTLVLRSALTRDKFHAIMTALGISAGVLTWGVAAAIGASALLAASEIAYQVVTASGILYMIYLGLTMFVTSFRNYAPRDPAQAVATTGSPWRAFGTGLWMNLLNPKVGVFYIAMIPQFIPTGASALGMGLVLAGVHVLIGFVWFTLIIGTASYARRWLSHPAALRWIDRVAGTLIMAFGLKLAFEQRW